MIYAAYTSDGRWTGVTYPARSDAANRYHAGLGESLFAVHDLVEVDGAFVELVPDVDIARTVAVQRMVDWIADFTGRFSAGVPAEEVASWPTKSAAAHAHLVGDPQPMIVAEAGVTGEDTDDLARAIIVKSDLYTAIIARVTGLRRQTATAIAAADTPEAVRAVLLAARDQAEAMQQELGL